MCEWIYWFLHSYELLTLIGVYCMLRFRCVFDYCMWIALTCGGGRPPAPSGHTGSMVSFLGVLHWQSGDGWRGCHSELASLSINTGLTRGISHSVVMLLQGKFLSVDEKRTNQDDEPQESIDAWMWLTLEVRPPCSESQNQACPTRLHQSISSEHLWDARCCRRIKGPPCTVLC